MSEKLAKIEEAMQAMFLSSEEGGTQVQWIGVNSGVQAVVRIQENILILNEEKVIQVTCVSGEPNAIFIYVQKGAQLYRIVVPQSVTVKLLSQEWESPEELEGKTFKFGKVGDVKEMVDIFIETSVMTYEEHASYSTNESLSKHLKSIPQNKENCFSIEELSVDAFYVIKSNKGQPLYLVHSKIYDYSKGIVLYKLNDKVLTLKIDDDIEVQGLAGDGKSYKVPEM